MEEKENQTSAQQHAPTTMPLNTPPPTNPQKVTLQSANILPSTAALISSEQALNSSKCDGFAAQKMPERRDRGIQVQRRRRGQLG